MSEKETNPYAMTVEQALKSVAWDRDTMGRGPHPNADGWSADELLIQAAVRRLG